MGNGFKTPFGTVKWSDVTGLFGGATKESDSSLQKRADLNAQGKAAGDFASTGEQGYGSMTGELAKQRAGIERIASGADSVSAEQLRQNLQQNVATQRSMAASAAPANAAMAARTASMQAARMGTGLSGAQALAGIQERQAAQQALANLNLGQRAQDLQASLGSRQTAVGAYGGLTPEKSWLEKWANPLAGGLSAAAAFSDERLKEDVKDGDGDANKAIEGLRAFSFKYKDQKHGAGKQVGVMAQDLEKVGMKHAVFETPQGKAVHGAKLALGNTAMIAALGRRVAELEGKGK